eukprot:364425-Chlamydomonas_euryale.AAC.13
MPGGTRRKSRDWVRVGSESAGAWPRREVGGSSGGLSPVVGRRWEGPIRGSGQIRRRRRCAAHDATLPCMSPPREGEKGETDGECCTS